MWNAESVACRANIFFKLKPRGTNVYWSRPPSWIISSLTPTEQVTELSVSFNIPDGGRTVTLQNTPALKVTESVLHLSDVEYRVDFQNYSFVVWCTILEIDLQSWWNESAGVLFSGAEVARGKSRDVIKGSGTGNFPWKLWVGPPATYIGNRRKNEHKELPSCKTFRRNFA